MKESSNRAKDIEAHRGIGFGEMGFLRWRNFKQGGNSYENETIRRHTTPEPRADLIRKVRWAPSDDVNEDTVHTWA